MSELQNIIPLSDEENSKSEKNASTKSLAAKVNSAVSAENTPAENSTKRRSIFQKLFQKSPPKESNSRLDTQRVAQRNINHQLQELYEEDILKKSNERAAALGDYYNFRNVNDSIGVEAEQEETRPTGAESLELQDQRNKEQEINAEETTEVEKQGSRNQEDDQIEPADQLKTHVNSIRANITRPNKGVISAFEQQQRNIARQPPIEESAKRNSITNETRSSMWNEQTTNERPLGARPKTSDFITFLNPDGSIPEDLRLLDRRNGQPLHIDINEAQGKPPPPTLFQNRVRALREDFMRERTPISSASAYHTPLTSIPQEQAFNFESRRQETIASPPGNIRINRRSVSFGNQATDIEIPGVTDQPTRNAEMNNQGRSSTRAKSPMGRNPSKAFNSVRYNTRDRTQSESSEEEVASRSRRSSSRGNESSMRPEEKVNVTEYYRMIRTSINCMEKAEDSRESLLFFLTAAEKEHQSWSRILDKEPCLAELFIRCLTYKLCGSIQNIVLNEDPRTFEDLVTAIIRGSNHIRTIDIIMREAQDATQKPSESPLGFIHRLENLRREFNLACMKENLLQRQHDNLLKRLEEYMFQSAVDGIIDAEMGPRIRNYADMEDIIHNLADIKNVLEKHRDRAVRIAFKTGNDTTSRKGNDDQIKAVVTEVLYNIGLTNGPQQNRAHNGNRSTPRSNQEGQRYQGGQSNYQRNNPNDGRRADNYDGSYRRDNRGYDRRDDNYDRRTDNYRRDNQGYGRRADNYDGNFQRNNQNGGRRAGNGNYYGNNPQNYNANAYRRPDGNNSFDRNQQNYQGQPGNGRYSQPREQNYANNNQYNNANNRMPNRAPNTERSEPRTPRFMDDMPKN